MSARITQRDVARKAGVSHVTVSLALRGHHGIPEKTRKRIEEIAREIGYVPDPMLASLSAYRMSCRPAAYQSNIAWISDCSKSEELYQTFSHNYYKGAAERARELGYNLEGVRLEEVNDNPVQLERMLSAKGISGLLLGPSRSLGGKRCTKELRMNLSHFSAVRFGHSYRYPVLNTVANAQFRTALMTMHHITQLGYRRIGIVLTHRLDERTDWNFLGGFRSGQDLVARGDRLEPFYIDGEVNMRKVVSWITKYKIECIIDVSYSMYDHLTAFGIDIPDEVGYANMDLIFGRHISGMDQNSLRIGVVAVDLLVGMMQRGEQGIPEVPLYLNVDSSWNVGTTAVQLNNRTVKRRARRGM